jgi:tetratricopeptide (TPR) repeat protein
MTRSSGDRGCGNGSDSIALRDVEKWAALLVVTMVKTNSTAEGLVASVAAALRTGRLGLFCGAGISLNSGLPTAKALIGSVLSQFQASDHTRDSLTNTRLPFEAFMSTLQSAVAISELLDIFKLGEPNSNHFLIAQLVREKMLRTICTTNFDTLIEAALVASGLEEGRDFTVLRTNDDFANFDSRKECVRLFKLHGSIDSTESVAISLQAVASKRLSRGHQRALRYLFSGELSDSVLLLGYSCSDIFDISPEVEALANPSLRVVRIEHVTTQKDANRRASVRMTTSTAPFTGYELASTYYADTDRFVADLGEELNLAIGPVDSNPAEATGWQEAVEGWSNAVQARHSATARDMTLGLLLQQIGRLSEARDHFERLIVLSRELGDQDSEAKGLLNLALIEESLDDCEKARSHFDLAASMSSSCNDLLLRFAIDRAIVTFQMRSGDYRGAISQIIRLLARCNELGDRSLEVSLLGELGIAHLAMHELEEALMFFGESLKLAREIGDKHGEGLRLGNLGQVYSEQQRHFDAISCFTQACDIAENLGDRQAEGNHSFNLATVFLALNIPREAEKAARRAVSSFRHVYDSTSPAITQAESLLAFVTFVARLG